MRSHFSLDTDTDTYLFEQDPSYGTAFHKCFFFLILVRTFWMEGLTRTEPAVSRACSAGTGPYLPIWIFLVIGRIKNESLTCPHSRARSAPPTDFNWLRPLPRPHPVRRLYISSAETSRTRARTGSRLGVRRSTNWATGLRIPTIAQNGAGLARRPLNHTGTLTHTHTLNQTQA